MTFESIVVPHGAKFLLNQNVNRDIGPAINRRTPGLCSEGMRADPPNLVFGQSRRMHHRKFVVRRRVKRRGFRASAAHLVPVVDKASHDLAPVEFVGSCLRSAMQIRASGYPLTEPIAQARKQSTQESHLPSIRSHDTYSARSSTQMCTAQWVQC